MVSRRTDEYRPSPGSRHASQRHGLCDKDLCLPDRLLGRFQSGGGSGRIRLYAGYPVEKLLRDAKIFQIFEGTNQIQQVVLGAMLSKVSPQLHTPVFPGGARVAAWGAFGFA